MENTLDARHHSVGRTAVRLAVGRTAVRPYKFTISLIHFYEL